MNKNYIFYFVVNAWSEKHQRQQQQKRNKENKKNKTTNHERTMVVATTNNQTLQIKYLIFKKTKRRRGKKQGLKLLNHYFDTMTNDNKRE